MPVIIDGSSGITTPTYGGADTSEYLVPVTQFKNRIINGAMVIDQRNAGASVTPSNTAYTLDRWQCFLSGGGAYSVQQTSTAPSGFVNSLLVTTTTADASIAAGDYYILTHKIEGNNVADLNWGSANAKTVTLSFWVRSSLTGTFSGSLQNSANNRSYPFSYTISSANTFEYKTVTITGDTRGSWYTNNNLEGIRIIFGLGVGSSVSGTAGAWASATYLSATGATSVVGTNGATFYITGVQLEKGSTATSFDYRPYGTELALCQRYYEKVSNTSNNAFCTGMATQSTVFRGFLGFQVEKRATPSVGYSSANSFLIQGNNTNYTPTATGTVGYGTKGVYTQFGTTGMTQGHALCLIDGSGSYAEFIAEL